MGVRTGAGALLLLLAVGLGGCGSGSDRVWIESGDIDGDGVLDPLDLCASVPDALQSDQDGDGVGDLCDGDLDGDGVANGSDNCPKVANGNQLDADDDGIGDACDTNRDSDGDGIDDGADNCPTVANGAQADVDGDGRGDACDPDSDNDGVNDVADNCSRSPNADQSDLDGDGLGDACDGDLDGDGIANATDNCPAHANPDQADADGDRVGDECDRGDDYDNDGVADDRDNCPLVRNIDQADLDGDGRGDLCDGDRDGDGVADEADNCPLTPNPDQLDDDQDGVGNACDAASAAVSCGTGMAYQPLVVPNATVSSGLSGLCLLCAVTGEGNVIDDDADRGFPNAARMSATLGAPGGTFLQVSDLRAGQVYPAGSRVAYLVASPTALLSRDLLRGLVVTTYLDGVPRESAGSSQSLPLELLSVAGDGGRFLVGFTAAKGFDGVRIDFGSALAVLTSIDVYAACVGAATTP